MVAPLLLEAAYELLDYLRSIGRSSCLIGGVVVSRWGEPRATQDVDATALADFGEESALALTLARQFACRDADPAPRADLGRLVLLTASNGVKIDLSLAAFPFELEVLQRASPWEVLPDRPILTCSAEDLLIYKLVAARPLDLVDIAGIARRQGRRLDADRIRHWGRIFAELKEEPDLLKPFEDAFGRATR